MGLYPHSGNQCSGLCNDSPPCPHEDCWQCGGMVAEQADRDAAKKLQQLEDAQKKAKGGLLGKTQNSANRPRAWFGRSPNIGPQMVPVERTVLEGLAAKAGMYINWMPNGEPVFVDPGMGSGAAFGNSIYGQAAKAIADASMKNIDDIAREMIKGHYVQDEKVAEEKLKAKGANDNDIEAAKRLLRSRPIPPEQTQLLLLLHALQRHCQLAYAYKTLSPDVDKT